MIRTRGEKIFIFCVCAFFVFFCISILLPFINLLAISFSGDGAITAGLVKLTPVDFTLENYQFMFENGQFWQSFKISVAMTVIGTALAMIVSTLCAYPLSKPSLRGRKKILLFFVFTMMFAGGLVPTYMLYKALGIYNTFWVLVLPGVMSVYNMLLIKNYMEAIPESLEESAYIDGASDLQVFKDIVLPLCKPVLATVTLFYAVGYWNNYFSGVMYITDPSLKPLQTFLYEIQHMSSMIMTMTPEQQMQFANVNSSAVQAATIVAATVPILIVYPFLQKHFVKGIVVGSEK